jgi:hypothetical protein
MRQLEVADIFSLLSVPADLNRHALSLAHP